VVGLVMRWSGLLLVTNCFLCVCIVVLHLQVLCGLYLFFKLCCFFGRLEVGYKATKVSDSGWMEYFGGQGLYWILFKLGRVNQWFQYNNLKVFLGVFVMWIVILLFILTYYLNSLWFRAWHWRCRWGIYMPLSIFICKSFFVFTVKV
jgi:hypothetical protein